MSGRTGAAGGVLPSMYRVIAVATSVTLVLWIAVSGLMAVSRNPYLVPVFWFLGLMGLFSCIGACLSVFPSPGDEESRPRPGRAALLLGIAAIGGALLWIQGRPSAEGLRTDFAIGGAILAILALIGLAALVILPVLLWSDEVEDPDDPLPIMAE